MITSESVWLCVYLCVFLSVPVYCWTPVKACCSVSAAVGLWVEYGGRPLVYTASTGCPLGCGAIPVKPLTMGVTMLGTPEDARLAGGELSPAETHTDFRSAEHTWNVKEPINYIFVHFLHLYCRI